MPLKRYLSFLHKENPSLLIVPHPEIAECKRSNLRPISRCRIRLKLISIKRDNKHGRSAKISIGYRNGKLKDQDQDLSN